MNSIWNKNLSLFMRRFPDLAGMFSLNSEADIPQDIPSHLLAPIEIINSRQNIPTAKDQGKFLHSMYNPLHEAMTSAQNAHNSLSDCYGCVFFSCGLGYTALSYAEQFPNDTIIIVENDVRYFFTALALVDWTSLFSHKNFIIALGTGIDAVLSLIEQTSSLKHTAICENPAQSQHSKDYFSALHSLIERNKRKVEINNSTLEKFSNLWLKNTCKNMIHLAELDGISIFKDSCPENLPVVILAAGPSLEKSLPYLKEIKKKSILIAVDTALRAALRVNVEPDFIVLTDPQYYAYRHIAGLSSPSSILITESAAYPCVYRFNCKKIILCASLFPLGQYIESKIGNKGALVAGGSVSTSAWDFARFIGAKEIFCAGLDLGYPNLQTHIKGSTFEEAIHATSLRIAPAEKKASAVLFGADMKYESDYEGKNILTDSKMKMFAWWFESKNEEFKNTIKSYSLSPDSLKIPGFLLESPEEFLSRKNVQIEKKEFFKSAENKSALMEKEKNSIKEKYDLAIESLKTGLEELYDIAKKAYRLAEEGIKSSNPQKYLAQLSKSDSEILNSEYKEIASLVFPTENLLAKLIQNLPPLADEIKSSLQKSKIIYQELMKSIKKYQNFI